MNISTEIHESAGRISRRTADGPYRASLEQERIWALAHAGNGGAYNMPATVKLLGKLNVKALERGICELIRRHEILRTHFEVVEDVLYQVVDPAPEGFLLPMQDCVASEVLQKEMELSRRGQEESLRLFDLAGGRLLRARLLKLDIDEHVLFLTTHQIVADEWSLELLLLELSKLYGAFAKYQSSSLLQTPLQYADYAVWQRHWLKTADFLKLAPCFNQQLSGGTLQLRINQSGSAPLSLVRQAIPLELPTGLSTKLAQLILKQRTTPFILYLAAFHFFLSRHFGQEDIVVGAPIKGRIDPDTWDFIGPFSNTLAVRADLSGSPSFLELLQRLNETVPEIYSTQAVVPVKQLLEELHPDATLSHQPTFQALIVLHSNRLEVINLPGLKFVRTDRHVVTEPVYLALHLFESPNGLHGHLEYASELFDIPTIEAMASRFVTLLTEIVTDG